MRKALQLASLACLAGLSLLYPLIESLDSYDSQVPASDLEIEIIVLLTFVGVVFVLAHLLASAAIYAILGAMRYLGGLISTPIRARDCLQAPLPTPSPPLALRI